MDVKDNDLVLLRLPNDPPYQGRQRHYNTWFRVKFIDNDGTAVGQCERAHFDYTFMNVGSVYTFNMDKVQHIHKDNEQFCYKDKVTVCSCNGLCKNS